jgi:hypothetical protein
MPHMDDHLKWKSLHSMTISEYCDGCLRVSNNVTVNLRKLFEVCSHVFVICEFRPYVPRNCALIVSIQTNRFIHSEFGIATAPYLLAVEYILFLIFEFCVY